MGPIRPWASGRGVERRQTEPRAWDHGAVEPRGMGPWRSPTMRAEQRGQRGERAVKENSA